MKTACKNPIITVLCCLALLLPVLAWAQAITVEYATGEERDEMYRVDIRLKVELSDEIIEALQHGVSLVMDIEIEVRRERSWLWDEYVGGKTLHYQLEHHPLSGDYLVIDLDNNARMQVQTLGEALDYIGTIRNLALVDAGELSDEESYLGLIRAELNVEELPPPLQPASFVSPEWHIESQWYEWVVR